MSQLNKLYRAIGRRANVDKFLLWNASRSVSNYTLRSDNILRSDIPDVNIPKVSVNEVVFSNISKFPNHVAVECAVSGRKYTYSELRKKCKNLSKTLRKRLKLNQRDLVAILLPNVPEYPIAALGCLEANLTVSGINPTYTPDEIKRQLQDSDAKAIITLDIFSETAKASLNLLKKNLPVMTVQTQPGQSTPQGTISFKEMIEDDVEMLDVTIDHNSLAFLPYSSGTTGLPKGVELTHSNIVSNLTQVNCPEVKVCYDTTNDTQDVIPAILPFFHIYGLVVVLLHSLRIGAKIVTVPKFTPDLFIDTLQRHKPDVLYVVPPIIIFMAAHPSVKSEDIASVRCIMSGAAPLGALDEERLSQKAKKDVQILQGYGLTETSPVVSMLAPRLWAEKSKSGSVGRLMPNTQAKVVGLDDPNCDPMGPNQTGELLLKGPQVMQGYHMRPEENKATFKDGWMRTGDIIHYDDCGFIFVTDRMKELIKVKGFQVPPAELEEVIRDHPDIADAAVIGIPHEKYGEAPRAYIVPKQNVKLDIKNVEEFVNSKVAHYKQLHGGISILDAIPKTASGKILKKDLKLMYEKDRK